MALDPALLFVDDFAALNEELNGQDNRPSESSVKRSRHTPEKRIGSSPLDPNDHRSRRSSYPHSNPRVFSLVGQRTYLSNLRAGNLTGNHSKGPAQMHPAD